MEITKDMLDLKISEFEDVTHNLTYREHIRACEDVLGISQVDLDCMSDKDLNDYDDWLFELSLK